MKKNLINVLVVGILILGLGIGLILIKQSQEIRERANVTSDILVSLSPNATTIAGGQKTTINVVLTNQASPVKDIGLYTAQVDLQFDTTYFSTSNVVCNSGFLPSPAVATVNGNKISLTCFAPGGSGARTIAAGSQTNLGSFDITAGSQTGTSNITVIDAVIPDATTQTDLSGNTGLGGSYTISGVGGGTPNPTANPTSNPTNPPSTSNPTSAPTRTPTPRPTNRGTAYPTATASSTPTPEVVLITTPSPSLTPAPTPQTLLGQLTSSNIFLIGGIGAIVLSLLIALILAFRRRGGNPPQINPPGGEPNPPVPPTPMPPTPETPTFQQQPEQQPVNFVPPATPPPSGETPPQQ